MLATRTARPEHLSPASSPTRSSRRDAPGPTPRDVRRLRQRDLVIASLLRCPDYDSDATAARAVAL